MPKSPSGDSLESLRKRWEQPKRQRLLTKFIGQRSFIDFGKPEDDVEDPTLIKDLRAAQLGGRDLHDLLLMNADMRWADFSQARIQGTFQHANLAQADFGRATLTGCRFWKARAIAARFDFATLVRSVFEHSSLFDANFLGARFSGVSFEHVDLRGADFAGAVFEACVLTQVKLPEADRALWEARSGCELREVEWCEEELIEA